MSEHVGFKFIISQATRISQEWTTVYVFEDRHYVFVRQFWCFAVSIQCCVRLPDFIWLHAKSFLMTRWLGIQVLVDVCVETAM